MKKTITYYQKCMCCNLLQAYILRSSNTNTSITDNDVYTIMSNASHPESRFKIDYCNKCKMNTKQEEVAWDCLDGEKAHVPKNMLIPE